MSDPNVEWVSTATKQPPAGHQVLLCYDTHHPTHLPFLGRLDEDGLYRAGFQELGIIPTHWMHTLPVPVREST